MSVTDEMVEWAVEALSHEAHAARRAKIEAILTQLREFPDPAGLPVGSTQRFLAQRRVDRLLVRAGALGFEPTSLALKKEMGKQIAGASLGIPL
ncbi:MULTISPECIES: hypothetical protein [Acidithiobacillaceae]|jgi:hypothetical protein|uniref:Uncharacterized protein n=1 Tax=Igneacidithiobacillus copahuensis TaxID=2724909 RepID=A0AAE2YN60_9PROT|nr:MULTISPECIES: hypothetical protein [Acidithiobacillaceae]MBU2763383.1 hypothetical protein [Acidithiobacillus caldus]MBU2771222.1 hypothetical protein [Acidithiobacillus caldus]MBU2787232.1 hypothetical protein [Igneacidithiobacillus copahuensis]MBU2797900.1 hypothetical protein [Acidithiobacillus sp. VAN18-2]